MATAKQHLSAASRPWLRIVLAVAVLVGGLAWYYGEAVGGYGDAGTSYGAKNACSCRYVAGRSLDSCRTDFLPGMEAVFLSEDEEQRSVTAYVPLVASNTAQYREGFGCVLEPWEG